MKSLIELLKEEITSIPTHNISKSAEKVFKIQNKLSIKTNFNF
jgi:hypothetical protein